MKITKGQKWRFRGENSQFYTNGKVYEVLTEPSQIGDDFDLFQVTDDRSGPPHHWSIKTLQESFAPEPPGPVVTETVTRKRIAAGIYGRLHVVGTLGDNECIIGLLSRDKDMPLDRGNFSIIEIRDLVTDLTAIADALEDGAQQ